MTLGPLAALVRKDLRLLFHDRRALALAFAAPIIVSGFIGWIFSGAGETHGHGVAVQIVNLDGSRFSTQLVDELAADPNLRVTHGSESDARARVMSGELAAAIIIPPHFADAMTAAAGGAEKPAIELPLDPSQATATAIVRGTLTQHVVGAIFNQLLNPPPPAATMPSAAASPAGPPAGMSRPPRAAATRPADGQASPGLLRSVSRILADDPQLRRQIARALPPFRIHDQPFTRTTRPFNHYAHAFAGMGLQFVMITAINFGAEILTERRRGLWRRLRAAPIRRGLLLAGKITSATLFAAASLGVAFAFAIVVFGVRIEGSAAGFFLCLISAAFMSACLAVFIAAVARTPEAARGLAVLVVLMLAMLGGAWFPAFLFPRWLQIATLALPTRWAIDGLDAMTWRGLPFTASLEPSAIVVGSSVILLLTALAVFKWDSE
jgi:ABC-2 type transport system permease protein